MKRSFSTSLTLMGLLLGLGTNLSKAGPITDPEHFEKDIKAFEAADQKNPPPKGAILFVGDSQFTRWKTIHEDLPGYTLINRGFGGSRMADLLHYVDRVVLPYKPRMIIVHEGGNDLQGKRTPDELFADIKAFIEKVQTALPGVPILISGLTPSPARWAQADMRRQVNQRVKEYIATLKGVQFVDLFDAYLGPDGKPREELFVADHLHHSAEGYKVRVRITKPFLGEPDQKP